MLENEFRDNFPPGCDPPVLLLQLLNYQNAAKTAYDGSFILIEGGKETSLRFFRDARTASQFAVFGHDGRGSLFALWMYEGRDCTSAPIVFLDSEGHGNSAIANSLTDFLILLSFGFRDFGDVLSNVSALQMNSQTAPNLEFRRWLEDVVKINPVSDPVTIIQSAKRNHPNLDDWITEQLL